MPPFRLALRPIQLVLRHSWNPSVSEFLFLDASSHLYKRVCPSVRWSVGRSVGHAFVKIEVKWPFMDSK